MEVKVIKNRNEYEKSLEILSKLMEGSSPDEEDTIELLLLVIKEYEQKEMTPLDLDPVEAIKFRMDQMNLSKKDLIPFLGSDSKISEIFSRKRRLSLAMIQKLHRELGIPLESLIGPASRPVRSRKQRPRKKKTPVPASRKRKTRLRSRR